MIMKYIGIAHEKGSHWYYINLFLYDKMITITPYTNRTKRPKYYFYNKQAFAHMIENNNLHFVWFFGVVLNQ